MKIFIAISGKQKLALSLLLMLVVLLAGVLLERHFIQRVSVASTSIYEDRLIPSSAIYHLADHISQRQLLLNTSSKAVTGNQLAYDLGQHRIKIDSILIVFAATYLVKDEASELNRLREHLLAYDQLESKLLHCADRASQEALSLLYLDIRQNLMALDQIQTRVGENLMTESQDISSHAGILSQLQVLVIILTCLFAQVVILASRAITSPIKQKHRLN